IRADLYSLGCTLYHLLAGRPPFSRGTLLEQLLAHREDTPRPVTAFRGDVPPGLAALVERLLAKDPARRPQTPTELVDALTPHPDRGGPRSGPWVETRTAPAVKRRGPHTALLAAAAAVLLTAGVATVGYLFWRERDGDAHQAPPQPAAVKPQPPEP